MSLSALKGIQDAHEGTQAAAEEHVTWRTDLSAAMAEARRTKRPLLAVFR